MWHWIEELQGSWFLPIYLPKNFEEYLRLLWDHTSSAYLSLIVASILLILLTLTFCTRRFNDGHKDPPRRSFHEEKAADNINVNYANVINRIKKAQIRAINKKMEANMSEDEVDEELESVIHSSLMNMLTTLKEMEENMSQDELEEKLEFVIHTSLTNMLTILQKMEENLSQDEVKKELETQQKQLSQIYSLIKEHEKEFGQISMEELKGQMNSLYRD